MADGYIDLSPIIRAVENSERRIQGNIAIVSTMVNDTQARLQALRQEVEEMKKQQAQQAALQRAITEIIRVRQELEEKFGSHKLVRDNMLGILQASDLSLIQESTISKCTEELMLSAPKYWLAPCLIALAGWLSNNESLAKRAIVEAAHRDKEKTALLFALICRRNGRTDTCFEWLSVYFKQQNPHKMRKSIIAYIDAYTNGVFGEDKDNLCQEHIDNWMNRLKKDNPNFDKEQEAYWQNYYEVICSANPSLGADYETLKAISPEAKNMDEYVRRIHAVDRSKGIRESFNEILDAEVNQKELADAIDEQLQLLVTGYEEEEEPLRKEEQFFTLVKEYQGNELQAKQRIRAMEARRYDPPVDFAKRLSDSITARGEAVVAVSARKTAIHLLNGHIEKAYKKFVTEKKDIYPEEISLQINEPGVDVGGVKGESFKWSGKTKNAENRDALKKSLAAQYDKAKDDSAVKVKNTNVIVMAFLAAACLLLGIIMFAAAKNTALGVIFIISTVLFGIFALVKMNGNKKKKADMLAYYEETKKKKVALLDQALSARVRINDVVKAFEADEKSTKLFA